MLIWVFNRDFIKRGAISTYKSLQWTEEYRGVGQLEFHYSYTNDPDDGARVLNLLQQGYFFYQRGKRTAMEVSYIERNKAEKLIIVYGHTTLNLLSNRVIYPQLSVRGRVEPAMYDIVNRFAVNPATNRRIPRLHLASGGSLPGTHEAEYLGEEISEALQDLAFVGDLGYYMEFDHEGKKHVFNIYQGRDLTHGNGIYPPAIFSDNYGNLTQSIIIDDWTQFKNVAYVGGEIKEGRQRVFVELGNTSGLDRREMFIDASSLQSEYRDDKGNDIVLTPAEYRRVLEHFGWKELSEYNKRMTYIGEIGNLDDWGTRYYLGDKVTCISNDYGLRVDGRIISYTEVTENNQKKLAVTFGEPEITGWRI